MTLSRRQLAEAALGILAASSTLTKVQSAAAQEAKPQAPDHDMSAFPASWHGSEKIAFLIYPQFTALDMVGPHYMLASLMGATTYLVAKSKAPVTSDQMLTFVPSHTFEDCPADLDIICVPGGSAGTLAAMEDAETIAFLKDRGSRAKYITSVCTGSLVLGAAGLLKGYKATSHWVARDLLPIFGAEAVDARVVTDRNRITGAGVTAGIDFGLQLVATLRDKQYAECLQLLAEYAPEPGFNAGTPATSPKVNTEMMSAMFVDFIAKAKAAAERTTTQKG